MSDLDNAINSINASAAKAENTATFLDDMSTFDDQSSVTNPNNGQTVASISKQVKDRTDELFTDAESDINQAVSDAAQSATDAQDAADSIGRYQGLWPDTDGSADKGDTYQTQVNGSPTGRYFTALQNTTVDPVGDDVNWRDVVSDGSLGNFVNYQSDNVSDMIIGVTVNGSVELIAGQVWQTKSFYSSGNSGASYVISSGLTANGSTVIDIDGSLSAKLIHNGASSVLQAGSSSSEGANITNAVTGLIEVGVKKIFVPLKSASLTSNIDLQGAELVGIDTVITGSKVYGGVMTNIRRESASSLQKAFPSREFSTSRTAQKVLIKTSQTGGGHISPYGETYSIISPSSYGGIARFDLINGVGGSGATDLGAPWDRLRCINSYMYDGGFAIKSQTSAESGGVTTSTVDVNNFYPNGSTIDYSSDGVLTNLCRNLPDGDYVEYVIPAGTAKANIAVVTSAGSTSSALVDVGGRQVADINCVAPDNRIVITEIDLDIYRSNTIRITNNGGFVAYVAGVNLIPIDRLHSTERADPYIDKVCLMNEVPVLYSGTGASIDSVLVLDGSVNGGSYHGGETAVTLGVAIKLKYGTEQETIYATTSVGAGTGLAVGDMRVSNQILVRNRTTIATNNTLYSWIDFDYSIDGGCNARIAYYPNSDSEDVTLTTIYTGMHSTDRSLSAFDYRSYGASDNARTEIPPENFPCVQAGGSAQVMYSPIMSNFDLNRDYLNQVWNASPYIKYYCTPVESTPVTIKGGSRFLGGCLYQYGKAIV